MFLKMLVTIKLGNNFYIITYGQVNKAEKAGEKQPENNGMVKVMGEDKTELNKSIEQNNGCVSRS